MSLKLSIIANFSYKYISFRSIEDYGIDCGTVYEVGFIFSDGGQAELKFKMFDLEKKSVCLEVDLDGNMIKFTKNYDRNFINIFV